MKIKIIYLIFLLSTLIHSQNNIDFFILKKDAQHMGIVFICPEFNKEYNLSENIQAFNYCAFDLKEVLDFADLNKLPVILIVNDDFDNKSTVCEEAPCTEGTRVALCWASYYFRFKNLNIRILKVPDIHTFNLSNNYKKRILLELLEKKSEVLMGTPEELMEKRIISITDTNIDTNFFEIKSGPVINLEQISVPRKIKKTNFIDPELPILKKNQKRFVVTGVSGFIGSHLAKHILDEGHQVIGIDNFLCSSDNNLLEILKYPDFYFKNLDVTLPLDIKGHIDEIIHLASVPSPEYYYNLPEETLTSGLFATREMLELAVKKNAGFLFSSTSEVYGDPNVSPQPETYEGNVNTIGKRSQYDQSKRGGETLCMLYFKKYKLDTRIARIFNTYGPNMQLNDGRVVTNFIEALINNKSMKIYGNGKQTRSFCFVSDTVDGLIKLLNIKNKNHIEDYIFNIGNSNEMTINELAIEINKLSKKFLNKEVSIEYVKQIDVTDPKQRCPDLTKSGAILGFSPEVKLESGLERTLKYFLN